MFAPLNSSLRDSVAQMINTKRFHWRANPTPKSL